MDTFDLRAYLAENKLYESEMSLFGKELASAIEDTLEDKKEELNEVIDPISILSYILAGTTLTNLLAKWTGKLFKKMNWGKGEEAAHKIEHFTHKLEEDFKSPIKRIIKLFTKDPKAVNIIADSLYAIVILSLGVKAGGGAVNSLMKGNIASGTLDGIKAALKGKDLGTLIKNISSTAV